jgi:hypothetical protein
VKPNASNLLLQEQQMPKPITATPKVKFFREIRPETNELVRRLMAELHISGNELTERAIRALAAQHGMRGAAGDEQPLRMEPAE